MERRTTPLLSLAGDVLETGAVSEGSESAPGDRGDAEQGKEREEEEDAAAGSSSAASGGSGGTSAARSAKMVCASWVLKASPVMKATRAITPRLIVDQHIWLVALFLLVAIWVVALALKVHYVVEMARGAGG